MKWINVKDQMPNKGDWIACIRTPYPAYTWMGQYTAILHDDEDLFDYWLPIPEIPERYDQGGQ